MAITIWRNIIDQFVHEQVTNVKKDGPQTSVWYNYEIIFLYFEVVGVITLLCIFLLSRSAYVNR